MITGAKRLKKLLNQKGQSIVEFLLFLPFMLMMYSVTISLSNAINASINQQKVTRAFWYYRNMNNSTIPRPRRDGAEPSTKWQVFGMQIMGWAEKLKGGQTPMAPCFKFALPLGGEADDTCDDSYSKATTQFIRVQTVYGVCGATYVKDNNFNVAYPRGGSVPGGASAKHCSIIE